MTSNELRTLTNVIARSKTLFDAGSGYAYEQFRADPANYTVTTPAGARYFVNLRSETCTCPSFAHRSCCKHLFGMQEEAARNDAILARFEENTRLMMDAETAEGCDPYAEF